MNWLDISLVGILAVALVWGMKVGLFQVAYLILGVAAGGWLAGRYASEIGGVLGGYLVSVPVMTSVSYWLILLAVVVAAAKVGARARAALSMRSMDPSLTIDRMGGLFFGGVGGVVVACAAIIVLARLGFDVTIETPSSEWVASEPKMVSIVNQRQALIDTLVGSRGVTVFMAAMDGFPGRALDENLSDDLLMGLDLLRRTTG